MKAFRFWTFPVYVLVLSLSYSYSRAVTEELSDIDKDLASILNQADGSATDSQMDKLDSVLSGFEVHPPAEESAKNTANMPETDRTLAGADDKRLDVNKLLDYLTKDDKTDMDAARRFGGRSSKANNDDETSEPIPEDILRSLGSGGANSVETIVEIPKVFSDSKEEKDRRLAKALLEDFERRSPKHIDDTPINNDDAIPKELLDDLNESGPKDNAEPIPRALLDDLKSGPKNNDEPIPQDLINDLKTENKDDTPHKEPACPECKRQALRDILMDELVSRMTAIAKRGDKIPRRMFDMWRKYRTKRGNTKRSDLKM